MGQLKHYFGFKISNFWKILQNLCGHPRKESTFFSTQILFQLGQKNNNQQNNSLLQFIENSSKIQIPEKNRLFFYSEGLFEF